MNRRKLWISAMVGTGLFITAWSAYVAVQVHVMNVEAASLLAYKGTGR